MLRNGSYSAWFRSPQGEGTGIVVLNDGKLTGGDTVLAYTGTYLQNGDRFSACVRTQRHTPGQPSVFGIDDLDLTLTCKSTPTTASCAGTAKQAPDLRFVATLVPMAEA
jgi:T3SS negative regulator,GrlR